jgi:hypothetical protein
MILRRKKIFDNEAQRRSAVDAIFERRRKFCARIALYNFVTDPFYQLSRTLGIIARCTFVR